MVVWAICVAKETMVLSMSSLESPLAADLVMLVSLLHYVPVIRGSRWTPTLPALKTYPPSNREPSLARPCMISPKNPTKLLGPPGS
jgi:hypothetical protein